MKLLIGERADFAGFALPDDGGLILTPAFDMTVEAVVRKIDLAADEPLGPGRFPVQNLVPLLEPVQFFGRAGPEFFRLLY